MLAATLGGPLILATRAINKENEDLTKGLGLTEVFALRRPTT